MDAIADAFAYCGLPAYVIAMLSGLGVCAVVVALALSLSRANRSIAVVVAGVAMMLGSASIGVGVLGKLSGQSQTDSAIREMPETSAEDAAEHKIIRAQGYEEAEKCVSIGVGGGAFPLVFGVAVLAAAALKKQSEDA